MLLRWLTTCLVLLTAAAIHSVDARQTAVAAGERSTAPRPTAGLRVVMDPATGEVVAEPTAADLGRAGVLHPKTRRRADELEVFDLPFGARGVVLDGWADHAMRVERRADGTLRLVCSHGDRHGETR